VSAVLPSLAGEAGWREDLGEAVQKFEGGETQGGPARGIGPREQVKNLVGTVADQAESVEGEGRPGAVANEPLEAGTVGRLDTDAGVQAEPAAMVPTEHVVGLLGLQEAMADKWLREGERLAGLEPLPGSLWHAYRREWATEPKRVPDVDVAGAGGWKKTVTLKTAYQQADPETILRVVLEAGELREAK
jgi:hypothetical protein